MRAVMKHLPFGLARKGFLLVTVPLLFQIAVAMMILIIALYERREYAE